MANFSPSNLVNGQAIFNEQMQSAEFRAPDIAAFGVANKSEIANPSLIALRARDDRPVSAYLPIRQAATGGTARAAAHTGARGDSVSASITWSTFSEPLSISLKQAGNNVLNWQQMYAATKRNAILNLLDRIDAYFVAQLVAKKSKVNTGGGNGSFDSLTTLTGTFGVTQTSADVVGTGTLFTTELSVGDVVTIATVEYTVATITDDTHLALSAVYAGTTAAGLTVARTPSYDYEVSLAEKDYFFQNAKATLEYNLYRGDLIGIVDDKAKVLAERLMASGSANATNYGFQFAGQSIIPSTRAVLSGYQGSGLFFKNGFVAVVPWIPKENRKAIDPRASMSVLGDYGSFTVPEIGVTFADHIYAERADTSASNGDTQDVVIQEEISIDIGVVVAPLSAATATPILSVGQLAT